MESDDQCPCGAKAEFALCCEPVIAGRCAETAEQLMRSRYSAFVVMNTGYLLDTWHPSKRPKSLALDSEQRWLGLQIKRTEGGGADASDEKGLVEFVARYKINGKGHRLHEVSHFARLNGQWFYVEGEFPVKPKKANAQRKLAF